MNKLNWNDAGPAGYVQNANYQSVHWFYDPALKPALGFEYEILNSNLEYEISNLRSDI